MQIEKVFLFLLHQSQLKTTTMSTQTTPNPKLIEFLSQMPDGYRKRALRAVQEQLDFYEGQLLKDIAHAIVCGINWRKTKERFNWWREVWEHYRYGKPLPPLPSDNALDTPATQYQIGQAVVLASGELLIKTEVGWAYLFGGQTLIGKPIGRPATLAEILAEAQKNWWVVNKNQTEICSPSGWVVLQMSYKGYQPTHKKSVEKYEIFGQECIVAHRLITALNLAK